MVAESIAPGYPDSRTCLLHQKLQMFNTCINFRNIREQSDDDEFYDCSNSENDVVESIKSKIEKMSKPEGRKCQLDDLKLIDSDEPLYIPITQEPVRKTEDQIEDDAEAMLKLGSENDTLVEMMSESLAFDMENFKAANPNGKFEDFIRWYSPRDWIKSDGENGYLSCRMLLPDNTWQKVWSNAKPIAARDQKRLFDDIKEAEIVMTFLESQNIGQIVQLTIASLFQMGLDSINYYSQNMNDVVIPNFDENYKKLMDVCCNLSRKSWSEKDNDRSGGNFQKKWLDLLKGIKKMENYICKSQSLYLKLFGSVNGSKELNEKERHLMSELLLEREVELDDAAKGVLSQRILALFMEMKRCVSLEQTEEMSLPKPSQREYTLKLKNSNEGAQFLRAIMKNNDFRICCAFSKNMTYNYNLK